MELAYDHLFAQLAPQLHEDDQALVDLVADTLGQLQDQWPDAKPAERLEAVKEILAQPVGGILLESQMVYALFMLGEWEDTPDWPGRLADAHEADPEYWGDVSFADAQAPNGPTSMVLEGRYAAYEEDEETGEEGDPQWGTFRATFRLDEPEYLFALVELNVAEGVTWRLEDEPGIAEDPNDPELLG